MIEEELIYRKIIDKWGKPAQRMMVMEECGELITAIAQWERGRVTDDDLISEMVDVQLMLNQLRFMVSDESKWNRWYAFKLSRIGRRLIDKL